MPDVILPAGYSAKYGSNTIMELSSGKIFDLQLNQVN